MPGYTDRAEDHSHTRHVPFPPRIRSAGEVDEHGNLHSPEDGRFVSKTGGFSAAIKKALNAFAGPDDDQGPTSSAYFADRDDAEPGRFWEIDHDSAGTFTIHMFHEESEHMEEDDDEQPAGIHVDLDTQEMTQLADEIALTLLDRDPPPFDPADRRSALIASMLALPRGGVAFADGRNFDFSQSGLEMTNANGETEVFALNGKELSQLHTAVVSALVKKAQATDRKVTEQFGRRP